MYRNKHNYYGLGISVNMVMINITYFLNFSLERKAQYDQQTVITKGFI